MTTLIHEMSRSQRALDREGEVAKSILKHWHDAVPNDRMAHLVKDATRAFLRSLQSRLASRDVQMGHWTFLRILWERDGVTKRELSVEAGVAEPTTFVALRAMEQLGYVRLAQRPDNLKNIYVYLTAKGSRLKKALVPFAEEVNAIGLQGLTDQEVEIVRRGLLTMIENLSRDPGIEK